MNYPDIFFTEEYSELFKDTAFGGESCHFNCVGIEYRFYKKPIEGTPYFDIVSPYGYSGPVAIEPDSDWISFIPAFHEYCLQENIIAEFARLHPFVEAPMLPESLHYEHDLIYIDLIQSEEQILTGFDKGCRSAIHQAKQTLGAIAFGNITPTWTLMYDATMKCKQAQSEYRFSLDFFHSMNELLSTAILISAYDYGDLCAGAIILQYGDYAHYFLSASDGTHRNIMNLIIQRAILKAKGMGCKIFNLGGGRKPHDSLESFKRSFSHTTKPFFTYRKVHNQDVYDKLCESRGIAPESEGYFPAYRRTNG